MSEQEDFEKELRLRDQFAIAAMQSLVSNVDLYNSYIEDEMSSKIETPEVYQERIKGRLERLAIVAYKIADEMRKARLMSFK